MKFAKEIERELVPEWRAKYLNYKQGKKKLEAVRRALNRLDRSTPRSPRRIAALLSPVSAHSKGPSILPSKSSSKGVAIAGSRHGTPHVNGQAAKRSEYPPSAGSLGSVGYFRDFQSEQEPLTGSTLNRGRQSNPPGMTRYGSIIGSPPSKPAEQNNALERPPTLELPSAALASEDGTDDEEGSVGQFSASPYSDRLAAPNGVSPIGAAKLPETTHQRYKRLHAQRSWSAPHKNGSRPLMKKMLFLRGRHSEMSAPASYDVPFETYKELEMRQTEFFSFLDAELEKVESFYKQRETEATNRMNVLREQLHIMRDRRLEELRAAEGTQQRSKKKAAEVGHSNRSTTDTNTFSKGKNSRESSQSGLSWTNPLDGAIQIARQGRFGKSSKALRDLATPEHPRPRELDSRRDYSRRPAASDVPYRTAKKKLKIALQEFYRGLELLKSYALLNRTAFRKINKKYDKTLNARPPLRYVTEKVNDAWFVQSDLVDCHMVAVEDLYARYFEKGNRKVAIGKLRVKTLRQGAYSGSAFRNGLMAAAGAVLALQGTTYAAQLEHDPNPTVATNSSFLLQIYASYMLMLLLMLLFCIACKVWTTSKINYVFVFEFDTRHHLDWRQLCELPCFCVLLLGLFMWLNFNRFGGSVLFLYYPVILIGLTLILLLFPAPVLYHRMRGWFLFSHWRLLLSGIYPVEFRDFFLGDMFCSLTHSMGGIELFFCLYANDWKNPQQCNSSHSRLLGFLTTLPGIWRAAQCLRRYRDTRNIFPHLVNCGKYCFTILFYMSLSLYRLDHSTHMKAFFIFCAVVNSIYCSLWDVVMDWSLGDPYASSMFLRDVLGYKNVWVYYFAMVIDPILRFNWIFYAIFTEELQFSALLSFMVSLSEVFRRGMWMVFRVENEHCTNVGRFRASRDVPLPYDVSNPDLASTTETSGVGIGRADAIEGTPPLAVVGANSYQDTPAHVTSKSPRTPTATGVDVERQSIGSSSAVPGTGSRRRRRSSVHAASPLIHGLNRVGTILHAAHAQDFERKKRPETKRGMADAEASSDDDDDDTRANEPEEVRLSVHQEAEYEDSEPSDLPSAESALREVSDQHNMPTRDLT